MPKSRTVINNAIFKTNDKELCNWLYFIYSLELNITIYPFIGKPIKGYIVKNIVRNLTLPKGKYELAFIRSKGTKAGSPINYENIKVIGFPKRLDSKVQYYIYEKLNEKGITLPNGYSCWSMVNDMTRKLLRYSGNSVSLGGGTQFTFPAYGYYALTPTSSSNPEELFSTRKDQLISSITKNKEHTSSPTSTDDEVKEFCNNLFPTA